MKMAEEGYWKKRMRYLACPECSAPVVTFEHRRVNGSWKVGEFLCLGDCERGERGLGGKDVQYEQRKTGKKIGVDGDYQCNREHMVYGPVWVNDFPQWMLCDGEEDLRMALDVGRAVISVMREAEYALPTQNAGLYIEKRLRNLLEKQDVLAEYQRAEREALARLVESFEEA